VFESQEKPEVKKLTSSMDKVKIFKSNESSSSEEENSSEDKDGGENVFDSIVDDNQIITSTVTHNVFEANSLIQFPNLNSSNNQSGLSLNNNACFESIVDVEYDEVQGKIIESN